MASSGSDGNRPITLLTIPCIDTTQDITIVGLTVLHYMNFGSGFTLALLQCYELLGCSGTFQGLFQPEVTSWEAIPIVTKLTIWEGLSYKASYYDNEIVAI